MTQQKMKGVAVIFVGEDLDVLLELCDRILVLCGGKVSGVVDARKATKEQIGLMMTSSDFIHSSPRPGETISQAEAMVAKSKEVKQND